MNFKVHYAEKELKGNIPCFKFVSTSLMEDFIKNKIFPKQESYSVILVYVKNEVFISDNNICDDTLIPFIWLFVDESIECNLGELNIYIYEFSSYEKAYEVALLLKEESPFCYEPNQVF